LTETAGWAIIGIRGETMGRKALPLDVSRSKIIQTQITVMELQAIHMVVDGRPRDENGHRFSNSDLVREALRAHPAVAKMLRALEAK
jgi:hypothetical protein